MEAVSQSFSKISEKLVKFSTINKIDAFNHFDWPESLEEDQYWFSPDALSVAGTPIFDELTEEQLIRLAKWECINSCSLNTSGERELINSVTLIMDELPLGETKEYLYHLINEENQHMWYFQKFCRMYGGKIYANKNVAVVNAEMSRSMDHFLTFARILLFEEIGHFFNIANSKDERVHPFVREVNRAHYNDEARHITFGRRVLRELSGPALKNQEDIEFAAEQLRKTLIVNYNSLFNPSMYRDAGLPSPMKIRAQLQESPVRQSVYKDQILKSADKAFKGIGIDLVYPGDDA